MSFFSAESLTFDFSSGCAASSFWQDANVNAAKAMMANTFFMMGSILWVGCFVFCCFVMYDCPVDQSQPLVSFFSLTVPIVEWSGCAISSLSHDANPKDARTKSANNFFILLLLKSGFLSNLFI